MNERTSLMRSLSAVSFSMYDLQLFLDTHPENMNAMMLFEQYKQKYQELSAEYEKRFGPLTAMNGVSDYQWKWIHSPWPWEYNSSLEA